MASKRILDCRSLACPQPMIETRAVFATAREPFQVLVAREGTGKGLVTFALEQGAQASMVAEEGHYVVTIEPAEKPPGEAPVAAGPTRDLVVYLSANTLGQGDEALGAILMRGFLATLFGYREEIHRILLLNGGVLLAVEGSTHLEQLRALEEHGAEVLVCGTCLDHFGLVDQLAVGRVSDMVSVVETLTGARRILRP